MFIVIPPIVALTLPAYCLLRSVSGHVSVPSLSDATLSHSAIQTASGGVKPDSFLTAPVCMSTMPESWLEYTPVT